MAYYFSGNVQSEIAAICRLIDRQIEQAQESCPLDEECLMDLRLILSELMINGCEHGNQNDRNKLVMLDLSVTEDRIEICVQDEGYGFALDLTQNTTHHLDCGGRGLWIVSHLVDEFSVKDNRVRCIMYLDHGSEISKK